MEETRVGELTEDVVTTIRAGAKLLTGPRRRRFQAEVAHRYCGGSPGRAERTFGWGREAVHTGLNEMRTGRRCFDAFGARGRKQTEQASPKLADEIREIVEPTVPADPTFQTTWAYTRLTAARVRDELLPRDADRQDVPTRPTVGEILNRRGDRRRRVRKTKAQKRWPKRRRSSRTSPRLVSVPPVIRPVCDSPATRRPR